MNAGGSAQGGKTTFWDELIKCPDEPHELKRILDAAGPSDAESIARATQNFLQRSQPGSRLPDDWQAMDRLYLRVVQCEREGEQLAPGRPEFRGAAGLIALTARVLHPEYFPEPPKAPRGQAGQGTPDNDDALRILKQYFS